MSHNAEAASVRERFAFVRSCQTTPGFHDSDPLRFFPLPPAPPGIGRWSFALALLSGHSRLLTPVSDPPAESRIANPPRPDERQVQRHQYPSVTRFAGPNL